MNTLKGEFPKEGQYVLGKMKEWVGNSEDPEGNGFFVVVKFCKTKISRDISVSYEWQAIGAEWFFGEEIDEWWDLQEITK